MDVVILLVFISLILVAAGLAFFLYRLREGDFDHGERLSLAPLADDGTTTARAPQTRITESHRDNSTEQPQGDQHASC